MKTTIIQIIFDLIGMNDALIKLMNAANRKSANAELCKIYVNISLECRIFLEQLNAEIKTQKQLLNETITTEPLVNVKESVVLKADKYSSAANILAESIDQLSILIKNYSKILNVTVLPTTTYTMLATQRKILEAYLRELQKNSSKE